MATKPTTKAKDPYDGAETPETVSEGTTEPQETPPAKSDAPPADEAHAGVEATLEVDVAALAQALQPETPASAPARAARTERFTATKADGTTVTIERDINTGAQREV